MPEKYYCYHKKPCDVDSDVLRLTEKLDILCRY